MPGAAAWSRRARMPRSSWHSVGRTRGGRSTSSIPAPSRRSRPRYWHASRSSTRSRPTSAAGRPMCVRASVSCEAGHWSRTCTFRCGTTCRACPAGLTWRRPCDMRCAIGRLILYFDDGRGHKCRRACHQTGDHYAKEFVICWPDAGARRWAIANTLIQSCKLNGIDPLAYLTDVHQRIVSGGTSLGSHNTQARPSRRCNSRRALTPPLQHPPLFLARDPHQPAQSTHLGAIGPYTVRASDPPEASFAELATDIVQPGQGG